jgi:hypothetical protein
LGQQETIATFAAAQGRSVEEVLAAARRANVVAWSEHTPLDDREVAAITAALAAGPNSLPPPPSPVVPVSIGGAATRRSMVPLAGAVAALVLLFGIGVAIVDASGDDGDSAEALSARGDEGDAEDDGNDEEDEASCVDLLVVAVNSLDLDGIDSSDGLDDDERADLERQMIASEDDYPELAADGECEDVLEDPEASEEFGARADPEAIDALGAMATVRFEQIGDTIAGDGGDATAPIDAAADRDACIALFADQINAIDLANVDVTDGFSEAELDDITNQRFEFARLHPKLRPDGECAPVASSLTGEELGRLSELVLPDRRDLLVGI